MTFITSVSQKYTKRKRKEKKSLLQSQRRLSLNMKRFFRLASTMFLLMLTAQNIALLSAHFRSITAYTDLSVYQVHHLEFSYNCPFYQVQLTASIDMLNTLLAARLHVDSYVLLKMDRFYIKSVTMWSCGDLFPFIMGSVGLIKYGKVGLIK